MSVSRYDLWYQTQFSTPDHTEGGVRRPKPTGQRKPLAIWLRHRPHKDLHLCTERTVRRIERRAQQLCLGEVKTSDPGLTVGHSPLPRRSGRLAAECGLGRYICV